MARTSSTRTIAASPDRVWEVVSDPEHMPRWWPGVKRMEEVAEDRFTQVFATKRGRPVRMDFQVLAVEAPARMAFSQDVAGTPFERILREAITEIALEPGADGGTHVTITQRHKLRGYKKTGGFMLRRATRARLNEALDGLERICA